MAGGKIAPPGAQCKKRIGRCGNRTPVPSVNIRVMPARRPLVALFALIAIGWTSLWPLVSAAHARLASEPMPLCHQAGMMVAIDQPGQPAQDPAHPQPRFHCPLCVMAFYGAYGPSLHVVPPVFRCVAVFDDAHCAATPDDLSLVLPPGRAPPLAA